MPSDDFNRANETPIAAPWTELAGSTGDVNLASNAITKSADGDHFLYYAGAAAGSDQASEFQIATVPTNNDWGPAVNVGANGFSGYVSSAFGATKEIFRFSAGSFTSVATFATTSPGAGDVMRIEREGSTIRWIRNGATMFSGTDSGLTGGQPGVFYFKGDGSLDNWSGGDLVPPETPVVRPDYSRFPKHRLRRSA